MVDFFVIVKHVTGRRLILYIKKRIESLDSGRIDYKEDGNQVPNVNPSLSR